MEKKQPVHRFWIAATVVAASVFGLGLRLVGIKWGLPDAWHSFTYHPDEIFQVGAMLRLNPFGLQFDPGFYSYPSFYMNLGSAVIQTAAACGVKIDDGAAYLIARLVVAALGVLSVPVVYWAGTRLYGRAVGVLAAVFVAIMPLHVVHSHFATVDVPAALMVAAALLGAGMILSRAPEPTHPATLSPSKGERVEGGGMAATYWPYIFAGAMAGIATGTKYNAALVMIPVVLAHFLREDGASLRGRLRDGKLWTSIVAFITGFVVSTPGVLVQPGRYVQGLLFELRHTSTGHGLVFTGRGPGWFDFVVNALGYGLGVFLLALVMGAVALAVVRRRRADWVILSFLIPYFLLISFSEVRFARYAILMLPPLAILLGRMIVEVHAVLKTQGAVSMRWGWIAMCAGVIIYTGLYAVALDRLFLPPDTRTRAAEWFESNVPEGATVGLPTIPWFYSPPLAPGITGTVGKENRYDLMSDSRWKLIANPDEEWDASVLTENSPTYVVMTDYEYEDVQRVRLPKAMRFLKIVKSDYREVAVFGQSVGIDGLKYGPAEHLPHDLKYMSPTIKIYRRK